MSAVVDASVITYDLAAGDLRGLNQRLHELTGKDAKTPWRILHPQGKHAIAAGVKVPVKIDIEGHVGYYCAGMNEQATISIHGLAGVGVAENMMSGVVRVKGHASQCAGASGHGGLLVIEGNASSRCGISMKGIDIVVHGSVGHMACFLAQAGNFVVCGDTDETLGDSLYEARIFVRGRTASLGTDCIEKQMRPEHFELLSCLLEKAHAIGVKPEQFRRYGSARKLYNFHVDHASMY